ncbi:BrnT family toxin [Duganella violaceipulchra]|uniref:BrnT family toxin n=1 Tax=Duganella violaceipulchra TaxID=2849652 RepID=A0AA41HC80_9BURK|nr:BrnT family toxin [Duganella violaceicalia]
MRFEWDQRKAAANLRKHGVSFDEAKTVFKDFDVRLIRDEAHSNGEDRFFAIGFSQRGRLLFVCHCYRRSETIRLISARKATPAETKFYR